MLDTGFIPIFSKLQSILLSCRNVKIYASSDLLSEFGNQHMRREHRSLEHGREYLVDRIRRSVNGDYHVDGHDITVYYHTPDLQTFCHISIPALHGV